MDSNTLIVLGIFVAAIGLIFLRKKGGVKELFPKSGWIIGPIVNGKNYSVGMPKTPTMRGRGWSFEFPDSDGSVHAVVNFSPPSLKGKKQIQMQYRVTGSGFTPSQNRSERARVGISFQREGDNWSGKNGYESYRWYAKVRPVLEEGIAAIIVDLDPWVWSNVKGKTGDTDLEAFHKAIDNMGNISVVFGGDRDAAHGVFSSKPAVFEMLSFLVI